VDAATIRRSGSAVTSVILNVLRHYNPTTGSGSGKTIASYIAYVRAGMAAGGENTPQCTMTGSTSAADWPATTSLPAGYVIQPSSGNSGGFQFVADSDGTTGAMSMEPTWCQTAGCQTNNDGTIAHWHNVGTLSAGSGTAIWPGPEGQSQLSDYVDNGYLTTWRLSATPNDGAGYIASMLSFLSHLLTSFPWTISSHTGPPSNESYAYADAEAEMAALNGIGFGIQSVNIGDSQLLATGAYPTSRNDWVNNFLKYPNAPIHHLQVNAPGQGFWWSPYPIGSSNPPVNSGIVVQNLSGSLIATVYCATGGLSVDCSPLAGDWVFISGNQNPNLNATWPPCQLVVCTSGIQFVVPSSIPIGTYYGGTVWAASFLPITMPFAVQHGASSVEVWECDLDYAFGAVTFPSGMGGCNSPPGLMGYDPNFESAISNTQLGLPSATGIHGGTTTGGAVTHF
jgi:hypothetical protein